MGIHILSTKPTLIMTEAAAPKAKKAAKPKVPAAHPPYAAMITAAVRGWLTRRDPPARRSLSTSWPTTRWMLPRPPSVSVWLSRRWLLPRNWCLPLLLARRELDLSSSLLRSPRQRNLRLRSQRLRNLRLPRSQLLRRPPRNLQLRNQLLRSQLLRNLLQRKLPSPRRRELRAVIKKSHSIVL